MFTVVKKVDNAHTIDRHGETIDSIILSKH